MVSKTMYLELIDGKKLVDIQNQMNTSGYQRIKATTIFQRNTATGVYDAFIYYDEDETYNKQITPNTGKIEMKPILIPKLTLKPIQKTIIEVEEIDIVDDGHDEIEDDELDFSIKNQPGDDE